MIRIAEKLEFMTERAVKVCTKACIGRKTGQKTMLSCHFSKNRLKIENF